MDHSESYETEGECDSVYEYDSDGLEYNEDNNCATGAAAPASQTLPGISDIYAPPASQTLPGISDIYAPPASQTLLGISDFDAPPASLYQSSNSWDPMESDSSPLQTKAFEGRYNSFRQSVTVAGKPQLEHGDQIILPPSALEQLLQNDASFPMLFEIRNDSKGRISHCGVSEFTAEEGTVLLPTWMMKNLQLEDGDLLDLKSVNLEKATFVKLQPHSVDFLGISNPKAVLEVTLSSKFFCLTKGDTIVINYNKKNYSIDIVETKPSFAVCILDTDCEVDFAPPLDYKEPVPVEGDKGSNDKPKFAPFTGTARRLDGKAVVQEKKEDGELLKSRNRTGGLQFAASVSKNNSKEKQHQTKIGSPKKKQFQPFSGKKYLLTD